MKTDDAIHLIIIVLILIAALSYIAIDGVDITHPANLKAADPMYHTIETKNIIDSGQLQYLPNWISFKNANAINAQPQLLYLQTAAVSLIGFITNAPWAVIYFIVCLFAAIAIGITYAIIHRFTNNTTALISASMLIFPFIPVTWLYPIYIGFWIQIVAYTFLLAALWMTLEYVYDNKTWALLCLGLFTAAIFALHPMDALLLVPFWMWAVYHAIKRKHWTELFFTSIMPALTLLAMFFSLIAAAGVAGGGYTPGWYTPPTDYTQPNPVLPSYFQMSPWSLVIITLICIGFACSEWRKHKLWLSIMIVFTGITILAPYVLKNPYYLMRLRFLSPFIYFPFIAAVITSFASLWKNDTMRWIIIATMCLFFLVPGYVSYKDINTAGEHITQERWDAYQTMKFYHEPLEHKFPRIVTVLSIEGSSQANTAMMEQVVADVYPQELIRHITNWKNNITDNAWNVEWNNEALRYSHIAKDESSFFKTHTYKEWPLQVQLTPDNFDCLYMENWNQDVADFNKHVIDTNLDYRIIYYKNGIVIACLSSLV